MPTLLLGAVNMASKLEVTGHDGSTFNWLNPQDGFELRRAVELLALAMRDKLPFTTPPDNFYSSIQSVYEMIWRFRENTRGAFPWYIRKDLAIGDDLSDFNTATRYDWDLLGTAIGEDLTFFKDMTFDDISYIQTGTIFPKTLLTTMYKIVEEISLYRARFGELPMDSYNEDWVNYDVDYYAPIGSGEVFARFESNPNGDPNFLTTQASAYADILSYINDASNYTNKNGIDFYNQSDPGVRNLIPRRIGAYFRSEGDIGEEGWRFYIFGRQFQNNYPSLAKSFNFGYYGQRDTGSNDIFSAGDFNNTFPDATTEYYQYVYSTKNGTGYTASNFFDFGGGFLEDKISHIQQAYSADGYILRTDDLTMDFSTIPNEQNASYGCQIKTILAFNMNEPRFTNYYTEPTP